MDDVELLNEYLRLESQVANLERRGDGDENTADKIRDRMDKMWLAMSESQRAELNINYNKRQ